MISDHSLTVNGHERGLIEPITAFELYGKRGAVTQVNGRQRGMNGIRSAIDRKRCPVSGNSRVVVTNRFRELGRGAFARPQRIGYHHVDRHRACRKYVDPILVLKEA